MTKLQHIEKEIAALDSLRIPLVALREVELAKALIKCERCKKKTQVQKLTLHEVVDYHCEDWEYVRDQYACPKCGENNHLSLISEQYPATYITVNNERVRPILALRRFFQKGETIYK